MRNHTGAGGSAAAPNYRPDIDGLRALAVGSVLLFHAGVPGVPGGFTGVDIFFVISGYLITSLLFLELDATGRVDFVNFWARRTRRLLPSALLVIVIALIASRAVLSDLKNVFAVRDALFAATYSTNWQKLTAAVDYFDDESGAGLFLHYWSLAVEEQFYLFLTLVFAAAIGASWLFRLSARTCAGIVAGLLIASGLISFVVNLVVVAQAQPAAFFGTHARIWQLAIGAGVGLAERARFAPPGFLRQAAAWGGLAMMLSAIGLFSDQLTYPGCAALVPTVGAALFILSGINAAGRGHAEGVTPWPSIAASHWLPVGVGKLSYALYLWHWPVFMLYKAQVDHWTGLDRAAAIVVAAALAMASHITIENPIRFSRALSLRPIVSLMLALAFTAGLCGVSLKAQLSAPANRINLAGGPALTPESVRHDLPRTYADHCHADQKDVTYGRCVYGRTGSVHKVFLVGDSHAAHWFPALEAIADRRGLALFSRTKSACIGIDIPILNSKWKRAYTECEAWRSAVLDEIDRERPELVILASSSAHRPLLVAEGRSATSQEAADILAAGELRTIARIRRSDAKVVLMADLVWLPDDPIDCLVSHPTNAKACRWQVEQSLPELRFPWSRPDTGRSSSVQVVDLIPNVCPGGVCFAATRDAVVLRDWHHMTATYSATLADVLDAHLFDTPAPARVADMRAELRGSAGLQGAYR
jgi:peptidoglycan/LPS O-acetylase OafA/YrhL